MGESNNSTALRLWPGVLVLALQWIGRYVVPLFVPEAAPFGAMGALLFGILILLWWAFFSRAPKSDRLVGAGAVLAGNLLFFPLLHPSIAGGGMGLLYFIYAAPFFSAVLVLWAALGDRLEGTTRTALLVAGIVLVGGAFNLLRTDGLWSVAGADLHWRWTPTAEAALLDQGDEAFAKPSSAPAPGTWPGFRGADRDGRVEGARIQTDWSKNPPRALWRRAVGPGWSSFAVRGNLLYTQEQRGEEELVSCYDLASGKPVWRHADKTRFWESNAGAGPRSTPTLHGERIYTVGATGVVNALDATTGKGIWTRNAAEDTGAEVPEWGFSASPFVTDALVYVAVSGALIAYERESGEPRWKGPVGGESYSSPQLLELGGQQQLVFINKAGATSFNPGDGKVLWEYAWSGFPVVQPARTPGGDLLLNAGGSTGLRRLTVATSEGAWKLEERWSSNKLRPNFNDFVQHQGHAYGLDGGSLVCMELEAGKRKWKDGDYGAGQLVLLPEQSLLLVLSEEGELALARATPEAFEELARMPALPGKTWNHPVLVGDVLLVRNDREMAAFRFGQGG